MTLPDSFDPAIIVRRSALLLTGIFVLAFAGCGDNDNGTGPAGSGTVGGTITSSLGGPLADIKVTATPTDGEAPAEVTTDSDGHFSVSGVPVSNGGGAIALADLPGNCTDPGPTAYTGLSDGETVTKDIEVTCRALVGTITGAVTSSLGGPLVDVHISLAAQGDSSLMDTTTDAGGRYTFNDVPAGAGSVAVSDVPGNCSVPAAATYDDLADGATDTVDVAVSCTATTGTLDITVNGLVAIDGDIHVTGPNGFDTTLTATASLADLEPGSYGVTAATVVVSDSVVTSEYVVIVTGAPATVAAGDTSDVVVTYAIRTGSGGLWFTNTGNNTISRFAAGQLHTSGTPADTTSIVGPGTPLVAAFDANENLWVSSASSDELVAYTRDQLVGGGTPTATLTLTSTALTSPRGMAFDSDGNLWVANGGDGSIVRFSAAQVEAGGSVTPAISMTGTGLSGPTGIAFDASGNLWVADYQSSTVAEFSASQLASGGSATPAVTLSAASGSLNQPTALALDESGNLWVANDTPIGADNIIVAFSPAERASSGSPAPSITIDLSGGPSPYGLAFDESGSLWVALHSGDALVKYSKSQLATGGALTPALTISPASGGTLSGPSALVFDPHASGLPIH